MFAKLSGLSKSFRATPKSCSKKINEYISRNNISVRDYQLSIESKKVIEECIIPMEVLSEDFNSKKERHYTTTLRHKYNYYSKIAGKKIRNQKEAIEALLTRIYKLERSLSHRQGFGL